MGRFSDEPKDGHHIFDGSMDFYYDAKEHCYYYLDEKKQRCYTSAGFILGPGVECEVVSCPICRACMNQTRVNHYPVCRFSDKLDIDLDVLEGRKFLCEYFEPNKDSYDYELVMNEIKQAKRKL